MKQMINSEAEAEKTISFDRLLLGFFRFKGGNGKIFYANQSGKSASVYPVMEDGLVSRKLAEVNIWETDKIETINHDSLGIPAIKWTTE